MNKKPTISSKSICTKKYYVNEMNQLDSYSHNPNQLEKNNHKNVIFRHSYWTYFFKKGDKIAK